MPVEGYPETGLRGIGKLTPLVSVLMIVFGSWLNAQGGWIKDFGQYSTVNLPLLFVTFSTSGKIWYFFGLSEDLIGLALNLTGLYFLRGSVVTEIKWKLRKPYFLVSISIYLIFDFLSLYYFLLYESGSVSLEIYGYVWNDSEYFVMLPMLILSDIMVFFYRQRISNE